MQKYELQEPRYNENEFDFKERKLRYDINHNLQYLTTPQLKVVDAMILKMAQVYSRKFREDLGWNNQINKI